MKQRKETRVTNAFTVDSIVTVYHFPVPDVEPDSSVTDRDVSYDFWQLYYVEQGTYACRLGGREVALHAGQLLLCEPGQVRTTLLQRDLQVGIISFRCHSDHMESLKNMPITLPGEGRKALQGLLQVGSDMFTAVSDSQLFVGQELRQGTSESKLQMLKNRLELLLIELYESMTGEESDATLSQNQKNYYTRQFEAITAFLRHNLHRNVTVSEICAHTGLSENTVKRVCRYVAGCGVIHYFLTLKMETAKDMLHRSDQTITQIAQCLGFSGVHYFSRLFKRMTGMSPRQYARKDIK